MLGIWAFGFVTKLPVECMQPFDDVMLIKHAGALTLQGIFSWQWSSCRCADLLCLRQL